MKMLCIITTIHDTSVMFCRIQKHIPIYYNYQNICSFTSWNVNKVLPGTVFSISLQMPWTPIEAKNICDTTQDYNPLLVSEKRQVTCQPESTNTKKINTSLYELYSYVVACSQTEGFNSVQNCIKMTAELTLTHQRLSNSLIHSQFRVCLVCSNKYPNYKIFWWLYRCLVHLSPLIKSKLGYHFFFHC